MDWGRHLQLYLEVEPSLYSAFIQNPLHQMHPIYGSDSWLETGKEIKK